MNKEERADRLYRDIAERISQESRAQRLQVGCVLVRETSIVSYGYNGMPHGWDNRCEHEIAGELHTRPEVLHAEANAIAKLARMGGGTVGLTLYTTHSPCLECSKLIVQSGIGRVRWSRPYRDRTGLDFLQVAGVDVRQLS